MKVLTLEYAEYLMKINNGNLNLTSYRELQTLPDNLTVGGGLDLRNTQIASLPDNLTVGGWLDLSGTQIDESERRKVKTIRNGDYVAGKYLFVDNILTQIKGKKTVGQYTVYVGKIKGQNVVSDGVNYAHCDKLREGIADLLFKAASDRGADQYKNLSTPDQVNIVPVSEKYEDYAKKVCDLLNNSDIRAAVDDRNETLGKRIRESELKRIPFLVIVGEKEMNEGTVSVRRQGGIDEGTMPVDDFVTLVSNEISNQLS